MSKGIVVIITGTLSLLFLSMMEGYPRMRSGHSVRIMFYNVENLFDIFDDTLTDDDEFLPDGVRRWNYTRYSRKINSLYKTILLQGSGLLRLLLHFVKLKTGKCLRILFTEQIFQNIIMVLFMRILRIREVLMSV